MEGEGAARVGLVEGREEEEQMKKTTAGQMRRMGIAPRP